MSGVTGKFDKWDRERVIGAVQEHCCVRLRRVGRRDKWLRDNSNRNWWVLGGIADWHGIPQEMMADEKLARLEGVLVMAEKKLTRMEIFMGPLGQLLSSRNRLYPAASGGRQFTVKVRGDVMRCVQAPVVVLKRIASIPHSEEDREHVRRRNEVSKILARLSEEELIELAEKRGLKRPIL